MKITKPARGLIGHRGAPKEFLENSLASFTAAIQQGLTWIECDLFLTQDGHWVCTHDSNLQRTHGISYEVANYPLSALQNKLQQIKAPQLTTLPELLELAKAYEVTVNIEVKHTQDAPKLLDALHAADYAKVVVSSFHLSFICSLRQLDPDIVIGMLVENFNQKALATVIAQKFNYLICNIEHIQAQDIATCKEHHIPVLLYTCNTAQHAKYWLDCGVFGLFTDCPGLC